jgi:hypothetical protein
MQDLIRKKQNVLLKQIIFYIHFESFYIHELTQLMLVSEELGLTA